MPNKSKIKGDKEERDVVNIHRSLGVDAQRTLETGKRSDGSDTWDITLDTPLGELRGECKLRKSGFKQIYGWLQDDFLTIRTDREDRLYVIPESLWEKIMVSLKELENVKKLNN